MIVGHSNTVPEMIKALGGDVAPTIDEKEYDDLFIVTIYAKGKAKVTQLKYGKQPYGPAWIGWVTFSKTGKTVHYSGRTLKRILLRGRHCRRQPHRCLAAREEFWISGVKKNGRGPPLGGRWQG